MAEENKQKVPLKEADTKKEKLLLGFINQEAHRIVYGKIFVEVTIHSGQITNVQAHDPKRSFNLNDD